MSSKRTRPQNQDVINLIDSDDDDAIEVDSDPEPHPSVHRAGPATQAGPSQKSALASLLQAPRNNNRSATQGTLDALLKPSKPSRFNTAAANTTVKATAAAAAPPAASDPRTAAAPAAPAAPAAAASEGSWEHLHAPKSEEELVVNKKKVQEVKIWLEGHLVSGRAVVPKVLLLTGPAGCGKSTVLRLLAQQLQLEMVEWTTPTPTLWSEFSYQDGIHVPYRSKLDEFEMFVARSKFAALPLFSSVGSSAASSSATSSAPDVMCSQQASTSSNATTTAAGRPRKLLVLDDLPHAADASHRHRLVRALQDLVATARGPVVIIATEPGSAGTKQGTGASAAVGSIKGLHKDVLSALESMGSQAISFNPVPPTSIAKHLNQIAAQRSLNIDSAAISSIAQTADGDLRNAVLTLQVMCMGKAYAGAASSKAPGKSRTKKGAGSKRDRAGSAAAAQQTAAALAAAQRDMGLNLFHFLGKVLYNKREEEEDTAAGSPAGSKSRKTSKAAAASAAAGRAAALQAAALKPLKQQYMRPPLRYDPEGILQQSGMDALPVASFLHENYTEFIEQDAMDDVAQAAAYISDAAFLALHRNTAAASSSAWDAEEGVASTLTDAAAGSTAVRGLLYANAHPAPRKWMPLRSPLLNQVHKATSSNLGVLQGTVSTAAAMAISSSCWTSLEAYASGVLVYLRVLTRSPAYSSYQVLLPPRWSHVWNGSIRETQQHAGAQQASRAAWQQEQPAEAEGMDDEDEIVED